MSILLLVQPYILNQRRGGNLPFPEKYLQIRDKVDRQNVELREESVSNERLHSLLQVTQTSKEWR